MQRTLKKKERKQQRSISILPSEEAKILKRYKSLTKYVDDCIMRDGIRKPKTS